MRMALAINVRWVVSTSMHSTKEKKCGGKGVGYGHKFAMLRIEHAAACEMGRLWLDLELPD